MSKHKILDACIIVTVFLLSLLAVLTRDPSLFRYVFWGLVVLPLPLIGRILSAQMELSQKRREYERTRKKREELRKQEDRRQEAEQRQRKQMASEQFAQRQKPML